MCQITNNTNSSNKIEVSRTKWKELEQFRRLNIFEIFESRINRKVKKFIFYKIKNKNKNEYTNKTNKTQK